MLMLRGIGVIIFLVIVWQLLIIFSQFPVYILPSPLQVGLSLLKNWQVLLINFLPTLTETILGLVGGIIVGMVIALSMMLFAWLRYWLLPVIVISQAIPTFALAPLIVVWFGYGMFSKIVTVVIMLFFPVASAFYEGLRRTPLEWVETAKIMSARKIRTLWYLRFPAALPQLATGIKLATAFAPIGAIISEWVGASRGLGFLMLNANARLDMQLVFASLVIIMLMSLSLYGFVNFLLRTVITWR